MRVLAPYDPRGPDVERDAPRRQAAARRAPDYLVSLGRTVGFRANGAVSNISFAPAGMAKLSHELSTAVMTSPTSTSRSRRWSAGRRRCRSACRWSAPSTLTRPSALPNALANVFGATQVLNRLRVRIAVSEAAAWTGERWFGGRYRVIPNGVNLDEGALDEALAATSREGDTLRILFVGQAVERKGLPLLLRAFEALREHIPTELTVIGPTEAELAPLLIDPRGVRALGKVDDATKHAELLAADVLAAPSLGGESFGMVLTEAFASGATVVASDIAGYRDVVEDGVDGVLVAPGDAQALAETLARALPRARAPPCACLYRRR